MWKFGRQHSEVSPLVDPPFQKPQTQVNSQVVKNQPRMPEGAQRQEDMWQPGFTQDFMKLEGGFIQDKIGSDEYFEVEHEEDAWEPRRSARFLTEEYAVKMHFVRQILGELQLKEEDMWEAFASHQNHRLPGYWTKEDNSFRKSWTNVQLWCNPPYSMMDKVTLKLLSDRVKLAVIVCPVWKSAAWWRTMCDLTEHYKEFPGGISFFEVYDERCGKLQDAGPLRWPVRVNLVRWEHYQWLMFDGYLWDNKIEERQKENISKAKARREREKKRLANQTWWQA